LNAPKIKAAPNNTHIIFVNNRKAEWVSNVALLVLVLKSNDPLLNNGPTGYAKKLIKRYVIIKKIVPVLK
jgi:hypothetical protein